ncbi:MAG: hypothetical protein RLY71_858 [Pseudomonadota bacterium]|jgi:hypothetical protein
MATNASPTHPAGGTIESSRSRTPAKEATKSPLTPATARSVEPPGSTFSYELRDPFAEVTYRTRTFGEMVDKADKLGAVRFHEVDADGKRTPVVKVGAGWHIEPAGQQPTTRGTDLESAGSNVVSINSSGKTPEAAFDRAEAEAIRAAHLARLQAALQERYVIKRAALQLGDLPVGQTEYRYRGDVSRVAFTESTFRLATDNNNPSVARSMVDVAETRNWRALRVAGNEDFKRMVWLEASLRGLKTLGYEPQQVDLDLLKREREQRSINHIEPVDARAVTADATAKESSARGSGGRKAVLAALEAVLVSRRVPIKQREAVMSAAAEQLAQRLRAGETLKVKVYDKAAPVQRPSVVPSPEVKRSRERAAPAR